MATLHRRKLRSGAVVWELTHGTGADRQRFLAGRTREEAQQVLKQFEQQLALHGQAPENGEIGVGLGRYTAFLEVNRRPGTVRRYLRVLKTFHRCFLTMHHPDVRTLRQIKPAHVEEYKTKRLGSAIEEAEDEETVRREAALQQEVASGYTAATRQANAKFGWLGRKKLRRSVTPRTINYELRVVSTFLRWAIAQNYLFVDPVSTVERFRLPKRVLPKFLTAEQLKRFFCGCDEDERRLFMTILLTGMRKGEATFLTWSDVNFELGVIFIQEKPEWNWKPKTDERIIPISPGLRPILEQQYDTRRSDVLVFPNQEGNRDTHILQKLKKVCRRAGLRPATVHALRHSFGAHLRMAGVSLADIADLLGHTDLATTQIYAKVQQEHLRQVISKLTPLVSEATSEPAPKLLPDSTTSGESLSKTIRSFQPSGAQAAQPQGGQTNGTMATTYAEGKPGGSIGAPKGTSPGQDQGDQGPGGPATAG